MRKLVFLCLAAAMIVITAVPAFSADSAGDPALAGFWSLTVPSTDASGKPCPFVPESMYFLGDQTVVMSNVPGLHLPYKATVTAKERETLEKRFPDLKGERLLLIKPNPRMGWLNTPMVYAYKIEGNELTLMLQGWSPAKFAREKK